ncbi:MAG TPA: hypothetical protein V6D47_06005 [Oscillatoriaceae cyanobacterium]
MDKVRTADLPAVPQARPAQASAPVTEPDAPGYDGDSAAGLGAAAEAAKAKPVSLSPAERQQVATKKATCPFIGSAVAMGALGVRNSADKPLASIDDVVALGNSGGGDLGEVLKLFATGNHAKMADGSGKLGAPVPNGLFSLDFPGSQGSHPGHSGILEGDPAQVDSGRFDQQNFDRLLSHAKNGYLKRSDLAAFMAENLARDPNAKVLAPHVGGLLLADTGRAIAQAFPAIAGKLRGNGDDQARKLAEATTKTLGEDNLIGTSGEFGLLMAFLAHSPNTKTIDGEPAISVADLTAMFKEHRLPDGWQNWPKYKKDWVENTTVLLAEAGKDYVKARKNSKA